MIDDDPGVAKVLGGDASGINGCFPIRDKIKRPVGMFAGRLMRMVVLVDRRLAGRCLP
jgi:hypothetical protein